MEPVLQSGQSGETMNGTPLSEWTQLSPPQVRMLNGLNFFTVENIAHASDQQINNIGMAGGMSGYVLRDLARAFHLTCAKEHAQDGRMVAELQKRDDIIAEMAAVAGHARGYREIRKAARSPAQGKLRNRKCLIPQLQLVAAASAELLTVPASVAGNTDANVQQMYYLANAVGNELQQE